MQDIKMDPRMLPPPQQHLPPRIEIIEQPKQRGMRFRYECEGRSAGSIPGENTTTDRKTWPSIRILNYTGEVTVRVSLVSKDHIPRPHPHSLVGKDCVKGICSVRVNPETQMTATFSNLGIQCVKRKEVAEALRLRQSLNVDPFRSYQNSDPQAMDIDLNIVRLCFEGFINQGESHLVLLPVLSHPIFDKKATCSAMLRICRVDRSFGGCKGGDDVYLLCDKVQKDDISICFYEDGTGWEAYGEFSPTDVHRQVAIVFRTPAYRNPNITEATKVHFQLKRTSDGETSEPKDFTYLPSQHVQPRIRSYTEPLKRKLDDQATKGRLRDFVFTRANPGGTKPDPGERYTPSVPFPERPFPSVLQPQDVYTDNIPVFERFLRNFPSSSSQKFPRMDPPQYSSTQPTNYFSQLGAQPSMAPPPQPMPSTSQAMASPQQHMASTQHSYRPALPNTMGYPDNMSITGHMASPATSMPRTLVTGHHAIPVPECFGSSVSNSTAMLQSSTMQQGAIAPAPGPPEETDIVNFESIGSFADIDTDLDKGMNNLSIEPDTTFSDIKTEPESATPYPNAIPPTNYTTEQHAPHVNIEAPSPQQFPQVTSPAQYELTATTGMDTTLSFLPSNGIPSFDLNEQAQILLASTNTIEDLVRD